MAHRAVCGHRPIIFISVGRLDVDALSRNGVSVKLILRRQLRALEAIARMMAVRHERQCGHSGALNGGEGSPGSARRYLFIIDVTDGTVGRFLSGWKLWASIASYEQQYYPALVRARGGRAAMQHDTRSRRAPERLSPAALPRSHDDSALACLHAPTFASPCAPPRSAAQLGSVCVLRAPSFAGWALGLCKRGFLDPATAEKITLDVSHDPTAALRTLLPPPLVAQVQKLMWHE